MIRRRYRTRRARQLAARRRDMAFGIALGVPSGLFLAIVIMANALLRYGHLPY